MNWKSLVSMQNLKLAWRRINTGRNFSHKRYFREFYLVYEGALDQNLASLRGQLLAKAWKATHPQRVYVPKPSGLQRPISLLGLEDQILLQAVANVFERKLSRPRRKVELSSVFSNIPAEQPRSIFFTRPWQETYCAFQKRCKTLFEAGNHWIAHFDLAAYYDTISHDLLFRIVSLRPRSEIFGEVSEWFRVWSASDPDSVTAHGIPQGPVASDFLAEAFFLPIDIALQKAEIEYVRYVDDIRLFATTENNARRAGIVLERLCRDRGLVPQGKKFAVSEAKTPKEAMGTLPSIPPCEEHEVEIQMGEAEALALLGSCVDGRPRRVTDKSRFRYVMYRAPRSPRILTIAMGLLQRHPEHMDAFVAYFSNYKTSRRIATGVSCLLESGIPYPYVRGELWHVLARLGSEVLLRNLLPLAREDAKRRKECAGLSWGVMNALIRCRELKLCTIGRRLHSETALIRALLAPRLGEDAFAAGGVVNEMLKGTTEEQLAAARELQKRGIGLVNTGLQATELPVICQNSLRALGVIPRVRKVARDWISERLCSRYHLQTGSVWRTLLTTQYEYALQILVEADAMFEVARGPWLQNQDSFNDLVVRSFIAFLALRGLPGGKQKIVGRDSKPVKYGNLLQTTGCLSGAFPTLCSEFLLVHERRNLLPGSHPYSQKGGERNRWLTKREQSTLVGRIGRALGEVICLVSKTL